MYEGPLVHVDWELTPDEWQELCDTLLAVPRTPFLESLLANGALRRE